MTSNQPYRISGGKLALAMLLALVVGAAAPVLSLLQVGLLLPVIVIGGVFMVFLYVYAGRLPAWLFLTVQLLTANLLVNDTFMWMLLAAGSIPALLCMRGIAARRPFFEQLRVSMAMFCLGMLAALGIAYAQYGAGMIARATDGLSGLFAQMPDAFFEPFVSAVNSAIPGSELPGGPMTVARYRSMITGVLALARETYQAALPGTLLSGAATAGILSTLWGSWLLARRGLATEDSYVSPERWFLPSGVTGGLSLMWLAAMLIAHSGYASGQSVQTAAFDLLNLAFSFQAVGAIDRYMLRRNKSDRFRQVVIVAVILLGWVLRVLGLALFLIGSGSAMFGSHGALRQLQDGDGNNRNE